MSGGKFHSYRITSTFGPEQVFKALALVCDHPAQREWAPDSHFDWIKRRIELRASTPEGLEECTRQFLGQIAKMGGGEDAFLPGKIQADGARWMRPFGVAVHDAATFGELIGKSLVEIGLRGVKVHDSVEFCRILLRATGPMADVFDHRAYVLEFPVPPYIRISYEGVIVLSKQMERR